MVLLIQYRNKNPMLDKTQNTYNLSDGRKIPYDPKACYNTKVTFLLELPLTDLTTNPIWDKNALKALCKGFVAYSVDKRQKTIFELTTEITKVIDAFRIDRQKSLEDIYFLMDENGLTRSVLERMAAVFTTVEMIKGLKRLLSPYRDNTIIKTHLVDIYQWLDAIARPDSNDLIEMLKEHYSSKTKSVNKTCDDKVSENARNVKPANLEIVKKFFDELDFKKAKWQELVAYLMFATGRRSCETLWVESTFKFGSERGKLAFTGQSKSKSYDKSQKVYDIPHHGDISRIFEARALLAKWTVNSKPSSRLITKHSDCQRLYSRALSSDIGGRLRTMMTTAGLETLKDFRVLYGIYFVQYKPLKYTYNAYLAKILGHDENDLNTANTYQKYRLMLPEEMDTHYTAQNDDSDATPEGEIVTESVISSNATTKIAKPSSSNISDVVERDATIARLGVTLGDFLRKITS